MLEEYYAFIDFGIIVSLGYHDSFDKAVEVSDNKYNTVWIMNSDNLKFLRDSINAVIGE